MDVIRCTVNIAYITSYHSAYEINSGRRVKSLFRSTYQLFRVESEDGVVSEYAFGFVQHQSDDFRSPLRQI